MLSGAHQTSVTQELSDPNMADLSVFTNAHNTINCNKTTNIINGCQALVRLVSALKYCSKFDVTQNENDQNIFINFMSTVYTNFLNDYIHLIDTHSDQLQQIHEALRSDDTFINCNIDSCNYTSRHYRRERDQENNIKIDNALLNFYISNIDSLHFYLLHLYDFGLRIKIDKNTQNIEQKDDQTYTDDTFDAAFAKICKTINQRRSITSSFDRFKSTTKFSIDAPQQGICLCLVS